MGLWTHPWEERGSLLIFLDLDGVLADFSNGFCQWHGLPEVPPKHQTSWPGICDHAGLSMAGLERSLRQASSTFWANLPVYPWAQELVSFLDSLDDVRIMTAAVASEDCVAGKLRWLYQHFPDLAPRTIFCREKFLLARSGVILIDDHDEQIDRFVAAGGFGISFPQPWNRSRIYVDDRLAWIRSQLHGAKHDSADARADSGVS